MSMDFDSGALQTQQDEEEYDQEDYAREEELHKLLTDLPDDMLEDSRDSTPELDGSACSHKNTGDSPKSKWIDPWSDPINPTPHAQNYNDGCHDEYVYESEAARFNGYQSRPAPHAWNQEHPFAPGDYRHIGTEKAPDTSDFSEYQMGDERFEQCHGDHNPFTSGPNEQGVEQYAARYNPAHQQKPEAAQSRDQYDHLQREFLHSTQRNAGEEQVAQLEILNKALRRQIEDLERKLEDCRRNLRCSEHQFAMVKDEKAGLAVSLKEAGRLMEEVKEREVHLQNKLKAVEQQVQRLSEKDQENIKKQKLADAAVDSMKQQMLELCRSDTLSRARQQHDRDLAVMKEQHKAALLDLQLKLDSASQALTDQAEAKQRLEERVRVVERQREEEQLERAAVMNSLTQRLEESQKQCAALLQTNSVQEMSQMQIQLQQVQSARTLSENVNKALQEDMADLKEQITLYESAVKHGVIALDLNSDWEKHLSESCLDLGLKKTNWKNGQSSGLAHLTDSKLPKEEALQLLRAELQRCLGCLKGKRQKIIHLQEELQQRQVQLEELQQRQVQLEEQQQRQVQLEEQRQAQTPADSQMNDLHKDKRQLQERVQSLEQKVSDLKQSEEKLKSANSELCSKMREMIQELDQEKQEAAARSERIQQQFRDDVVNRVRTELLQEHDARVELLSSQHQQELQQLQKQLQDVGDKMLAVQECYLSVCKEKSLLEELCSSKEEQLRAEMEVQHQASLTQLKAVWAQEKLTEIQQRLAAAEAEWKEQLQEVEKSWAQKLEEARTERQSRRAEKICQTDEASAGVSAEELNRRLLTLQLEAEEARSRTRSELQQKHLQETAKQVEAAVSRAYQRWLQDLASLPEYRAEKQRWEEETEQKVSRAVAEAKERWQENRTGLDQELAGLRKQLEQASKEREAAARSSEQAELQQQELLLQTELRIQQTEEEREELRRVSERCRDEAETLQRRNQELQRHLEKACRQLQLTVRQHKAAMLKLKEEHASGVRRAEQEHLLQLQEARKANESTILKHQQHLQRGLEEMKQQYLLTVKKIRGDMQRYLQESRQRAAAMMQAEVQRERQETARRLRRYYLSCLQELLEDAGNGAGPEKKIMSAASKLAAMAKVLETPDRRKPGKKCSLQSFSAVSRNLQEEKIPRKGRDPLEAPVREEREPGPGQSPLREPTPGSELRRQQNFYRLQLH